MKKFRFTLDKMLQFKNQILDREKNHLGQLQMRQNAIEQHIFSLEKYQVELGGEIACEQRKGVTAVQLQFYGMQIQNIRTQLHVLYEDLKKAEKETSEQRDVVIKASQEVFGLNKLYEKQLSEYKKNQEKAEQNLILEYISADLMRKK